MAEYALRPKIATCRELEDGSERLSASGPEDGSIADSAPKFDS